MGYTGRRPSNAPLSSGDIVNGIIAKEDLDTALQNEVDGKADQATTYTKTEVDNELADKVDKVTSTDNSVPTFNGTSGDIQNKNTMFIDDSGNVGIGTSSPASKLDVNGTLKATGAIIGNHSLGTGSFELNSGATGDRTTFIDFHSDDTYTDYSLRLIRDAGANGTSELAHRGTGNLQLTTQDAGNMIFRTASTEKLRILPTGGITFNGDTSTANALDDYEEGTWTPTAYISYYSGSLTTNSSYGTYVKIGNIITVYFTLSITKSGSFNTGITGLPFTHSNITGSGAYGTARENRTGSLYVLEGVSGSNITVLRRYDNSVLPDGTYVVSGSYTMPVLN